MGNMVSMTASATRRVSTLAMESNSPGGIGIRRSVTFMRSS